jgi:hypothetical protein
MGIGRNLLTACIDYLVALKTQTIRLDATPLGKKLYDSIGFLDEYQLDRWHGTMPCATDVSQTAVEKLNVDCVLPSDLEAFGADRQRLLRGILAAPDSIGYMRREDAKQYAYICATQGRSSWHIGPCVASKPESAVALLEAVCSQLAGKTCNIDVPRHSHDMAARLKLLGFQSARPFIRMYKGSNQYPGHPPMIHAIMGPEAG